MILLPSSLRDLGLHLLRPLSRWQLFLGRLLGLLDTHGAFVLLELFLFGVAGKAEATNLEECGKALCHRQGIA